MTLLTFTTLFIILAVRVEADSCSSEGRSLLQVGRDTKPHIIAEEQADFKVLVVGAPRTGTQSMSRALPRLGFHPLHSGQQSFARVPWCNHIFGNGSFEEAMLTMRGFDSAMDEPFHLIYEEVMHRFPDCKFVLTVSDPEKWYNSCRHFMSNHVEAPRVLEGLTEDVSSACQNLHYFACDFTAPQTPEVKDRCLRGYRNHYMRVKRIVPSERLLIFNLSDGYRPLAEFLGKEVPREPFPYEDHFITHKPVL